ncbi:hypothetical protein BKA64DRAFT_637552 [Cadophora sp. MPI-SDFR-AT-0126]|nr:hypothetical protein BKA64DRAFT_637552 [Leotiomycetes sp. MPI-SDFR-AT-0126]
MLSTFPFLASFLPPRTEPASSRLTVNLSHLISNAKSLVPHCTNCPSLHVPVSVGVEAPSGSIHPILNPEQDTTRRYTRHVHITGTSNDAKSNPTTTAYLPLITIAWPSPAPKLGTRRNHGDMVWHMAPNPERQDGTEQKTRYRTPQSMTANPLSMPSAGKRHLASSRTRSKEDEDAARQILLLFLLISVPLFVLFLTDPWKEWYLAEMVSSTSIDECEWTFVVPRGTAEDAPT